MPVMVSLCTQSTVPTAEFVPRFPKLYAAVVRSGGRGRGPSVEEREQNLRSLSGLFRQGKSSEKRGMGSHPLPNVSQRVGPALLGIK